MGDLISILSDTAQVGSLPDWLRAELRRAADELARLRAEVERLTGCLLGANSQAEDFERRYYLEQDRAETAERERDELRRRIAEAIVVQVDQIYPVSLHGIGAIDCVTIRLIGSDAKAVGGKRVALVVLDAEEAK